MKRPDGVVIIGIYQLVIGLIGVLGTCCLIIPIATVTTTGDSDLGFIPALGALALAFCSAAASSILSLAAGWGLLQLKQWARWLTIVIAVFSLFAFPIGTVIGALVIWYLFKEEVQAVFEPNAAPVQATAGPQLEPGPAAPDVPDQPENPDNPA
jgi:hypothetical protein